MNIYSKTEWAERVGDLYPSSMEYISCHSAARSVDAVAQVLDMRRPRSALFLSDKDPINNPEHGIILVEPDKWSLALTSRHVSGYQGSGPSDLSKTIALLDMFNVDFFEIDVSRNTLGKLYKSHLDKTSIKEIKSAAISSFSDHDVYAFAYHDDIDAAMNRTLYRRLSVDTLLSEYHPQVLHEYIQQDYFSSESISILYRIFEDFLRFVSGKDVIGFKLIEAATKELRESHPNLDAVTRNKISGFQEFAKGAFLIQRNLRAHSEERHRKFFGRREALIVSELFSLAEELFGHKIKLRL